MIRTTIRGARAKRIAPRKSIRITDNYTEPLVVSQIRIRLRQWRGPSGPRRGRQGTTGSALFDRERFGRLGRRGGLGGGGGQGLLEPLVFLLADLAALGHLVVAGPGFGMGTRVVFAGDEQVLEAVNVRLVP